MACQHLHFSDVKLACGDVESLGSQSCTRSLQLQVRPAPAAFVLPSTLTIEKIADIFFLSNMQTSGALGPVLICIPWKPVKYAHLAMIRPPVRLEMGFVITGHVFRLILMKFALPRP